MTCNICVLCLKMNIMFGYGYFLEWGKSNSKKNLDISVALLIFPIYVSGVEEFGCHLSPRGGAFEHHFSPGRLEFAQLKLHWNGVPMGTGTLQHTCTVKSQLKSGTLMVSCSYKIIENMETEALSHRSLNCFTECCAAFHKAYQLDSHPPFCHTPACCHKVHGRKFSSWNCISLL